MDKMISQIAESVANDVINKMKHSTTSRPTTKTTTHRKTKTTATTTTPTHKQTTQKPTPTKLKLSDQGFIKKEFSTLLSELKSVREAVSSSKNSRKIHKTVPKAANAKAKSVVPKRIQPTVTPSSKARSSFPHPEENPLLSEAVKLLRGLSTSSVSAKPTTPSSSTYPSLIKAMDLLRKASSSDSIVSEYNSKLKKAVALLKDFKFNGISKSSQTTLPVSATRSYRPSKDTNKNGNVESKESKSGLEKAIEILVKIQGEKKSNNHNAHLQLINDSENNAHQTPNERTNSQSQRPRKDEDYLTTTTHEKKEYERLHMNRKLKEGPSSSSEVPEIPEIDSMDSNDIIRSDETSDSKSSTANSSKDDKYENLIDKVAKEAAEEVEQSFFKNKKKQSHKSEFADMPKPDLWERPAKENDGFDEDTHGYRASGVGHSQSKTFGPTSRLFSIPTASTEIADADEMEPERLSTVRKLKSRHRWPSTSRTLPELKKFDIPQETVGEYM